MNALVKMSFRLMLRNKSMWFFLLIVPVISAVIMNLHVEQSVYGGDTDAELVHELESCTQRAVYAGDTTAFLVKVYDGSHTELSEYVLEQLAENGMFSVCRADVRGLSATDVRAQAETDAENDRAGVLLYLKPDYDEAVRQGDLTQGVMLYEVSDDERFSLFTAELMRIMDREAQVGVLTGGDNEQMKKMLAEVEDAMPEKSVVCIAGSDEISLNEKQSQQHSLIGYAIAILTLGFLFSGVLVAHSVIEEQDHQVFTRMMLTKTRGSTYFLSKVIVAVLLSFVQTLVLAVCLVCMPRFDAGIALSGFLFLMLLLGILFSIASLLLGILLGDVMSSNYAAFAFWSISALLAGLYFPLDETTAALKVLSYLMPQKWFMDAAKMLIVGDTGGYAVVLCVTAAYLTVICSIGSLGIRIKSHA